MKKILCTLLVGALMCQGGLAFAKDYDIEDENNDRRGDADRYSVYEDNNYVLGNISEEDENDYFEFVARRNGEMDIYFKFDDSRGSKNMVINLHLLDSSGNVVDEWYKSDGSTKFTRDVKKDDVYYLHVEYAGGVMTEPYYIQYDIDNVYY